MDEMFREVYEYLYKINKLDAKSYNRLISIYGIEIVHKVIDYMIDCDKDSIIKFDYYIDRLTKDFDKFSDKSILSIYMQEIGRIPRLSRGESFMYASEAYDIINELRELFKLVNTEYQKQTGVIFNSIIDEADFYKKECHDKEILDRINELYDRFICIREILVNGNIRVVVAASKRYFRDVNSFIEIIQWGNMGLMQAVEKYDPNFNTRFVTYAYYWIRQSIRNASKFEFSNAATVSYNAIERNSAKMKAINVLSTELGRKPTDEEIANYMGINIQQLKEIGIAFQEVISLSSKPYNSSDSDTNTTIADMFEDRNVNIDRMVSLRMLRNELFNIAQEHLSDMEKFVVLNRTGFLGDIKTFKEIGDMYGCTKQHIEQTYKRSLLKMRRVSGYKLRDFLE